MDWAGLVYFYSFSKCFFNFSLFCFGFSVSLSLFVYSKRSEKVLIKNNTNVINQPFKKKYVLSDKRPSTKDNYTGGVFV